jgi:hypothetical protein
LFAAVSVEELTQTSKKSSSAIIYKEVNIALSLYYHQFSPQGILLLGQTIA